MHAKTRTLLPKNGERMDTPTRSSMLNMLKYPIKEKKRAHFLIPDDRYLLPRNDWTVRLSGLAFMIFGTRKYKRTILAQKLKTLTNKAMPRIGDKLMKYIITVAIDIPAATVVDRY